MVFGGKNVEQKQKVHTARKLSKKSTLYLLDDFSVLVSEGKSGSVIFIYFCLAANWHHWNCISARKCISGSPS